MEFELKAKFMEKLKELVAYGKKKKSVLEYQEINDFFRDMPLDAEQMEKVFEYLEASGIDVLRLVRYDRGSKCGGPRSSPSGRR